MNKEQAVVFMWERFHVHCWTCANNNVLYSHIGNDEAGPVAIVREDGDITICMDLLPSAICYWETDIKAIKPTLVGRVKRFIHNLFYSNRKARHCRRHGITEDI